MKQFGSGFLNVFKTFTPKGIKNKFKEICKDSIERPLNSIFFSKIHKLMMMIIKLLNEVIKTINGKSKTIIEMMNIMIDFIDRYIYGFILAFNDIMMNMREIIDLYVNITSGHLLGWVSIMLTSFINIGLAPFGVSISFTTTVSLVRMLFYAIMIGNMYNILEFLSSDYSPSQTNYIVDCNDY